MGDRSGRALSANQLTYPQAYGQDSAHNLRAACVQTALSPNHPRSITSGVPLNSDRKPLKVLLKISMAISAMFVLVSCAAMDSSVTQAAKTVAVDADEHSCLAEAIYFEAGSTSDAGRRAVGEVILNRAADPRFPPTICGVINQRYNGSCQFSYRCDGIAEEYRSAAVKSASQQMATLLLTSRQEDITSGALFFHAAYMPPGWFNTLDPRGNFGGNVFYR